MNNCKGSNIPMEPKFKYDENSEAFNEHTYGQTIGYLSYFALVARLDIQFAVSYLSRYLKKPNIQLWMAAKRILKYLKNTKDLKLVFEKNEDLNLICYSDSE